MADEKAIGISGEFDAEAVVKGLNIYLNALLKAEGVTDRVVGHMNALGKSLDTVVTASSGLGRASTEINAFRTTIAAISKKIPDAKPLNAFFNEVAKGAAKLAPVQSQIRTITSLNRSITALSQAAPVSKAVIDSLDLLGPAVTKLGATPDLGKVSRSLFNLSAAVNNLSNIKDVPLTALETLTRLGPRLKTLQRIPDLSRLGVVFQQISNAVNTFASIKAVPGAAIATLSAISNALNSISKMQGVGDASAVILRVANAMNRFSVVKAVPTAVLQTLGQVASVLRALAQVPDLGRVTGALSRLATSLNKLSIVKPIPPAVISSMRQMVLVLNQFSGGLLSNVNALVATTNALTTAMNRLGGASAKAAPQLTQFGNAFRAGIAIGVGQQAVQVFINLGRAIAGAGQAAFTTVAFFERFNLTIQSALALQARAADSTLDMATALAQAERPAEGYQRILEKIAILSPFSVQGVAEAFQLATAYGFTADEALRLTQAIADFTAGRGLSEEAGQRISRSLAQIQNRGKLTADNVRELAEAGVPVYDILGKAFNLTKQELIEMQEDGLIPADEGIEAIVSSMEGDFEGAAKRMATTFTGLISAVKDLKQLTARDLFGPIFESLQPTLQAFIEFVASDQFRGTLVAVGKLLGEQMAKAVVFLKNAFLGLLNTWKNLNPKTKEAVLIFALMVAAVLATTAAIGGITLVVGTLLNPFVLLTTTVAALATLWVQNFAAIERTTLSVLSTITTALSNVGIAVVGFGANIVTSLANGMTQAVNAVLIPIQLIGSLITSLMAPGSPPKFLPDLDKWGMETANVYLQGWTKADFDELDKFGGLIASQIRNLAGLGQVEEVDVPRMIIGSRQAIAQALQEIDQFGKATEGVINRIASTAGLAAQTVAGYLERYAAVRKATEALSVAQDELNATIKGYDKLLDPLRKKLTDIERAQENAEEVKVIARLRRIIANQNINSARRSQAELELERILTENQIQSLEDEKTAAEETGKAKVDAVQSTLDAAQEELAIFNQRIQEQVEFNQLLAEEHRIRQQLAEALARLKDPRILALEEEAKKWSIQQEFLSNLIEMEKQRFILADKDATVAQKKTAELRLQELSLENQILIIEAAKLGVDLTPLNSIPITLEDMGIKLDAVGAKIDGLFPKFKGVSEVDIDQPIKDFEKAVKDATKEINQMGIDFDKVMQNINDSLPPFLRFRSAVDGEEAPGPNNILAIVGGLAAAIGTTRIISLVGGLAGALLGLTNPIGLISIAVGLLAAAWIGNWFNIREHTARAVDKSKLMLNQLEFDVRTFAANSGEMWSQLKKDLDDVGTGFQTFGDNSGSMWDQLVKDVQGVAQAFSDWVSNIDFSGINAAFTGLWTMVGQAVIDALPILTQVGKDIWDGILAGFKSLALSTAWIGEAFTAIFTNIKRYLGIESPSTLFQDEIGKPSGQGFIDGMIAIVVAAPTLVLKAIRDLITGLVSADNLAWVVEQAGLIGTGIVNGIKDGISGTFEETKQFFKDTLGGLFGAGEEEIEAGSPSKRAARVLGAPLGEGVLAGLLKALDRNEIKRILDNALDAFKTLKVSSVDIADELKTEIIALFEKMTTDSIPHVQKLETEVKTAFTRLKLFTGLTFTALRTEGVRAIQGFRTDSIFEVQGFRDDAVNQVQLLSLSLTGTSGVIPTMTGKVVGFFVAMTLAVVAEVQNMSKQVLDLLAGEQGLANSLTEQFTNKGTGLGTSFGKGISDGILGQLELIKFSTVFVVTEAVKAGLEVLQAQSPSKVTEEKLGGAYSQGFVRGILGGLNDIKSASIRLASSAVSSANSRIGSGAGQTSRTINNSSTRVYQLNVNSTQPSRGIVRDFGVMEVMNPA